MERVGSKGVLSVTKTTKTLSLICMHIMLLILFFLLVHCKNEEIPTIKVLLSGGDVTFCSFEVSSDRTLKVQYGDLMAMEKEGEMKNVVSAEKKLKLIEFESIKKLTMSVQNYGKLNNKRVMATDAIYISAFIRDAEYLGAYYDIFSTENKCVQELARALIRISPITTPYTNREVERFYADWKYRNEPLGVMGIEFRKEFVQFCDETDGAW